jgi:hypothetical protein
VWLGFASGGFPRLYSLSNQPYHSIKDMGEREDDVWIWKLNWRRPSFVWKEELHNRLLAVLDSAIISTKVDSWEYQLDKGGMYSVKVNYLYLCHLFYSSSTSSLDASRRCLVAGI